MYKQIKDIEGKTIKSVEYSFNGMIILVFNDCSYCVLKAEKDYDDCLDVNIVTINPLEIENDEMLINTNIVTKEEIVALRKERKLKWHF